VAAGEDQKIMYSKYTVGTSPDAKRVSSISDVQIMIISSAVMQSQQEIRAQYVVTNI
jgi:hypothetical protein